MNDINDLSLLEYLVGQVAGPTLKQYGSQAPEKNAVHAVDYAIALMKEIHRFPKSYLGVISLTDKDIECLRK